MAKVISTFAGIGGSSTGYKQAGCEVTHVVELLKPAAQVYKDNYPNTKVINDDIRNVTRETFGLKPKELDILDGSPPCTAFSLQDTTHGSNFIKKKWNRTVNYRGHKQRVDNLFDEQIRLVSELLPKTFIMENVKGMLFPPSLYLLQNYIVQLKQLGYNVQTKVLNANFYETATARQRVIIMGIRKDIGKPQFPKPQKPLILRDVWPDSPQEEIDEAFARSNTYTVKELIKQTTQGRDYSGFRSHKRLAFGKPAPTLNTCEKVVHPTESRLITRTEMKALQSFPLDYIMNCNYATVQLGLGNSVPPNLIKHIANQLITIINSKD